MRIVNLLFLASWISIIVVGCQSEYGIQWGNDPINAESIYECDIMPDNETFEIHTIVGADKSKLVTITHNCFAMSDYYRLYSPNGNLRLIASGSQEGRCLSGYSIEYNVDGSIAEISSIGYLDDDDFYQVEEGGESSITILHNWLINSEKVMMRYPVGRDEYGRIQSVGEVHLSSYYEGQYELHFYLKEWGPFWTSDLEGGEIGLFVLVKRTDKKDGSYVNYLFCNDRLVAELAYWKDTFIKARTYNRLGQMVNIYDQRDLDIINQTFYDWTESTLWYVDDL